MPKRRETTAELLSKWTDSDTAMQIVGTNLGLFGVGLLDPEVVLASETPLRNALFDVLLSLAEGGAVDVQPTDDGHYAFRWRADYALGALSAEATTSFDFEVPSPYLAELLELRHERDVAVARAEAAEAILAAREHVVPLGQHDDIEDEDEDDEDEDEDEIEEAFDEEALDESDAEYEDDEDDEHDEHDEVVRADEEEPVEDEVDEETELADESDIVDIAAIEAAEYAAAEDEVAEDDIGEGETDEPAEVIYITPPPRKSRTTPSKSTATARKSAAAPRKRKTRKDLEERLSSALGPIDIPEPAADAPAKLSKWSAYTLDKPGSLLTVENLAQEG